MYWLINLQCRTCHYAHLAHFIRFFKRFSSILYLATRMSFKCGEGWSGETASRILWILTADSTFKHWVSILHIALLNL